MRILSIIAALTITVFAASSCGILGGTAPAAGTNATTNVTTGSTNGQAAGAALKALYTQYKADGNKLNMTNLTNIVNLTTLANNVQGLKGMSNKADFYKEFASGLVLGSNNLITQNNSNSIMNGLQNLVNNVDLSGLQNKANNAATKGAEALENATTIANSVSSILGLFK
ncbi:MAG: hypothetical protein IJN26_07295 [Bacteroidales bacterium]|nr:hypothetical protein [Bacteroidales bacterium]MBQ6710484.1 hypothetical protein [Bacteroidales bacterium]